MTNKLNEIQEQITALTNAHEEGIDTVANGIQDLYKIVDHLSSQMRAADLLIASMKFLLIKNKVISESSLDEMYANIVKLSNKELQEFKPDTKKPTADNMQSELKIIHDAAAKAAETPYDADAFIFGK